MMLSTSVVLFAASSSGSTAQFGEALFPSSELDMVCLSSINNSTLEKKKIKHLLGICYLLLFLSFTLTISNLLPQQVVSKAFPGIFAMVFLLWHQWYQPQSPLFLLLSILFPNSQLFAR